MGLPLRAFHQRVFAAAIVAHAITAWYSGGWYGDDEHYQVIAFAQQRLGELPAHELTWEYGERIRSALLPGLAYGIITAFRAAGITDPFTIAFGLRMITALCALMVVRRFVRTRLPQVADRLQGPFVLISYFLWFLPWQHVRFAAETWSGLLLLAGITALLGDGRWRWLLAGLLLGGCIQMKPAMIAACGGLAVWALHGTKERPRATALLLVGGTAALLAGAFADSWFYHEHVFTLWSYLHKNSLSISRIAPLPTASEIFPWYYYFTWIAKHGIWPIGAGLLTALLWLTWHAPRSWPVWTAWPYLVLLSLVPHKELRFLFSLADLAPIILILAWQTLSEGAARRALAHSALLIPLVAINLCALLVAGTTDAGSGRTRLARTLVAIPTNGPVTIGYALDREAIWKVRIPSFYLPVDVKDIGTWQPGNSGVPDLVIAPGPDPARSNQTAIGSAGYRPITSSEPTWATPLLWLYNTDRPPPYVLYTRDAMLPAAHTGR